MKAEKISGVIFDLDGVITETEKLHSRSWKLMFDEYLEYRKKTGKSGFEPMDPAVDYSEYIDGIPRYDGVIKFLNSRNIDLPYGHPNDKPGFETVCALGNKKNEFFLELLKEKGTKVYPDTVAYIKNLKQKNIPVAVISSSKNGREILKTVNLTHFCNVIIDGNDATVLNLKGKPAPDIFLAAARQLKTKPEETAVFEDAPMGIQAAKEGGFHPVIGVARSNSEKKLIDAGADWTVHSLEDTKVKFPEEKSDSQPLPALEAFNKVVKKIGSRQLAVFLDYDGTLTPIVSQPQNAVLSDDMRQVILELSKLLPVAVISGRDRKDVEERVGISNIYYAGSHGFDISGHPEPEQVRKLIPVFDQAEKKLHQEIGNFEGIFIERKKYAIAVHYRNTPEKEVFRIKEAVKKVTTEASGLKCSGGKKVFELKPDFDWDKGKAIKWLMNKLKMDSGTTAVVYLGDDITDEDAFREMTELSGISVLVDSHEGKTNAAFQLKNVKEVKQFLQKLIKLAKEK